MSRPRPPFIISAKDVAEKTHTYPNSDEPMAPYRPIGIQAGLVRIGVDITRVPPGRRTSYPHAEEAEEEFCYVIEGEIDAWIDGTLYRMRAGDLAAFPSGTGISHTFINNGARDALLFTGGQASVRWSRIVYPLNPERRGDMPWRAWWDEAPKRKLGPHDGLPDARRAAGRKARPAAKRHRKRKAKK